MHESVRRKLKIGLCGLFALATLSVSAQPAFVRGAIITATYDGVSDDLLTAGLGASGLVGAAPGFADPLNPTAAELRRLAIYNNYRALVDMTPGGGYGTLYGPAVGTDGTTESDGRIKGREYLAFAGSANVVLMVQIPATFDPQNACIVTAPSSGSRGVYGAIATAGEWGLKRGCAVAYTDKGTGTGAHGLQANRVNGLQGEQDSLLVLGREAHFSARLSQGQRLRFNGDTPNRFAFKHAHSRRNPERDWGQAVLWSIELALYLLDQAYPAAGITPDNTLVIASSVSNGGGASLLAAEQDRAGLIDGVAVSEPNVNPVFDSRFVIVQQNRAPLAEHSRSLFDYTTLLNVYQGCANADPALAAAPLALTGVLFAQPLAQNRCQSLFEQGLLAAPDPAAAQAVINRYGFLPEQNIVQPSHWWLSVPQAIAVTYANAYARARVQDNLCGYSFAATDANSLGTVPDSGQPQPLDPAAAAALFATSNGIPPTGGVNDAILPPNHTSRAYYGLNQVVEQAASGLRYIEVTNAQHLDALNGSAGFDNRFVPLHHYYIQALDRLYAHLRDGAPLPPSQVVRSVPRGGAPGAAPPIDEALNLPPIALRPALDALITLDNGELFIPE